MERPRAAKVVFVLYLGLIIGFDVFLSFDIFFSQFDCTSDNDWQFYTLVTCDTIQTLLLTVISIIMYKSR